MLLTLLSQIKSRLNLSINTVAFVSLSHRKRVDMTMNQKLQSCKRTELQIIQAVKGCCLEFNSYVLISILVKHFYRIILITIQSRIFILKLASVKEWLGIIFTKKIILIPLIVIMLLWQTMLNATQREHYC